MRSLRYLHTGWGLLVFMVLFLIFFLPLLVPILFPSRYRWVGVINRWWARLLFVGCVLPVRVQCQTSFSNQKQYIFCPNHFSYLDIPTMGLNPVDAIFVGKNDMENIPLFGFMYRRLHITVDRARLKSKYDTYVKSKEALEAGKSLIIYPEGGIISEQPPEMVRFKDGAFRLAIEKQIPLVPVTIPNNWILLPPSEFLLRWGVVKVIFHQPISTDGLTLADLKPLKQRVFEVIDRELKNNGNRQTPSEQTGTPVPSGAR